MGMGGFEIETSHKGINAIQKKKRNDVARHHHAVKCELLIEYQRVNVGWGWSPQQTGRILIVNKCFLFYSVLFEFIY